MNFWETFIFVDWNVKCFHHKRSSALFGLCQNNQKKSLEATRRVFVLFCCDILWPFLGLVFGLIFWAKICLRMPRNSIRVIFFCCPRNFRFLTENLVTKKTNHGKSLSGRVWREWAPERWIEPLRCRTKPIWMNVEPKWTRKEKLQDTQRMEWVVSSGQWWWLSW